MTDNAAPAWATVLLAEMNTRFDQAEAKLVAIELRNNRQADRITGVVELANAADASGAGLEIAKLERDLVQSHKMAALSRVVNSMQKQIDQLEGQVRELRRGTRHG